jgi:haloacetate dehalogenase
MFEGFERHDVETDEARIASFIGGSGPPLLLLHGYPQTHVAWHRLVPVLARHYTVVATDLRGYGDSRGPQQVDAAAYSKRTMARDQLALMKHFGFDRFGLVGHDRGARVGYRLVLDHPGTVLAFVSLTVIPTSEMWERADKAFALGAYHWALFAQPYDLPERLLSADPDFFLEWTLRKMAKDRGSLSEEAVAAYTDAFRRSDVRHAMMQDYRAGATIDHEHDLADRAAGHIVDCPVLVLWEEGRFSQNETPLDIWRAWAGHVEGLAIPGGHLQAEEQPDIVLEAIRPFLARHLHR